MALLAAADLESRLVLLAGPEGALRRLALEELKQLIGDDDFDSQELLGGESALIDWIASAGTHPFLADRRTVIVRYLLRTDVKDIEPAHLAELSSLPPSTRLILVADEEQGDDQKQRDFDKRRTFWSNAVKKAGGVIVDFHNELENPNRAVQTWISGQGLKISDKALALLMEMTGGSYSRAVEEVEKLALFVEPGAPIQPSDVEAVVVPSREWNVFKLCDAIVAGNLGLAMGQLRNMLGTATKAEGTAFGQIFPNLSGQFRLIWQARLCIEGQCQPGNPSSAVRAMLPAKGDISKEKDWKQRRAMQAARKLSLPQIRTCFQAIADADSSMKGTGASYSGIETLEQTVMKMVAVVDAA